MLSDNLRQVLAPSRGMDRRLPRLDGTGLSARQGLCIAIEVTLAQSARVRTNSHDRTCERECRRVAAAARTLAYTRRRIAVQQAVCKRLCLREYRLDSC